MSSYGSMINFSPRAPTWSLWARELDYLWTKITARRRGWGSWRRLTYLINAQSIETFLPKQTVEKKGRIGLSVVGWDLVSQQLCRKWQLRMRLTMWFDMGTRRSLTLPWFQQIGLAFTTSSRSSVKLFHGNGSPTRQLFFILYLFTSH